MIKKERTRKCVRSFCEYFSNPYTKQFMKQPLTQQLLQ